MNSVLQNWVMELPLREQGTLLTVVRGCDLTPKQPYDSSERKIVSWLRFCFMNPADKREVDIKGAFFQSSVPFFKASDFGHYPQHWYSHIMHALEIIAYRHPESHIRDNAYGLYINMVYNLHLEPESRQTMINRLSEDRYATGKVVS